MFSHLTQDFLRNKLSFSIGLVFIAMGLLFGNWATFIPYVKYKFDLDDAQLGLLLLSIPIGALVMNPLAAISVRIFGMNKTTIYGYTFLLISFSLLLNAYNVYLLSFFMFLCGNGIALTNVGMNTCVGAIERDEKVKIMSTCHGMFSLGLMIGSVQASFFRGFGVNPGIYLIVLSIILYLILSYFKSNLLNIKDIISNSENRTKSFVLPRGNFLFMIVIALCINITEGTMADWTAVYMRDIVQTNTFFIGWGLAGYSFFMAMGRFLGDKIIPKYGTKNILVGGGFLVIFGLLISILLPYTAAVIFGFALVGAGVSCGAPILYASAARVPNMAPGSGLALMNTFAMGGFLFGPVLIGFISNAYSLPLAFGVIASLAVVWILFSRKTKMY